MENQTMQTVPQAIPAGPLGNLKNGQNLNVLNKMHKVMSEMGYVQKTGYNTFHKYNYVEESAIVDRVRKAMVEVGLAISMNMLEFNISGDYAVGKVEFTLYCIDTGESVVSSIVVEGQDKGDKKFPKLYASAMKYFLMKTFLIPTGDDPEADITMDRQNYGTAPTSPYNNGKGAPTRQDMINQVNSLVQQFVNRGAAPQYVYVLCKDKINRDFQETTSLSDSELQTISSLLNAELNK